MSAHTPGPWRVVRRPRVVDLKAEVSIGSGSNGMASVAWMTGGRPGNDADARLIAAAPDLLAALRGARRLLSDLVLDGEGNDIFRAVTAAIAKAEGKP